MQEKPKKPRKKREVGPNNELVLGERKRIQRVLELRALETPSELIAQATGTSETYVRSVIDQYSSVFKNLAELRDLRKIKGEILDSTIFTILKRINSDDIVNTSNLKELADALERIHKISRLESNQSTENNSTHVTFTAVKGSKGLDDIE